MKTQDTCDLSDRVDSCIPESSTTKPRLLSVLDYAEIYLIYEG